MREDLQLGYLVLEAVDPGALDATFVDVLGLQAVGDEESYAYRMDDWDRRFVLRTGDQDRLAGAGLVAANEMSYRGVLDRLRAAGVALRGGSPAECAQRSVREFVAFEDPGGLPLELAIAPRKARGGPFVSPLVPGGFQTGSQGLGHIVALADDRDASVAFHTGVLGFHISDTIEEDTPYGTALATFMHCNKRHHTLAIGQRGEHHPKDKILGHFMLQANEIDAVGLAYDRALDAGMPIFRTLGRHPNDRMFSFYARTTAGFDVEFGAGAIEISDDWQVLHHGEMSAWGHRRGQGFEHS